MDKDKVYTGEVDWFSVPRGYGFITWYLDGKKMDDMFAHYSDVVSEGFKLLKAGQKVEFMIGENNAGRPKAVEIKVIG